MKQTAISVLSALVLMAGMIFVPSAVAAQDDDTKVNGPALEDGKDYFAQIKTDKGDIIVDLLESDSPITVRNFVNLAEGTKPFKDPKSGQVKLAPYYDGVIFHRIIKGFMIQSGDPTGTGRGGPGYTIKDETINGLKFRQTPYQYTMAMANTGRPNSGGAQWFITDQNDSPSYAGLEGGYTIFGRVHTGEDVVDAIAGVEVKPSPSGERSSPVTPPKIETVVIHRVGEGETIESKLTAE